MNHKNRQLEKGISGQNFGGKPVKKIINLPLSAGLALLSQIRLNSLILVIVLQVGQNCIFNISKFFGRCSFQGLEEGDTLSVLEF